MDRRDFLKLSAVGSLSLWTPPIFADRLSGKDFGWVPDWATTRNFLASTSRPYFVQNSGQSVKGSGKGRVVLLHKALERALGREIIPHDQKIGDCVGQAAGFAIDVLTATQVFLHGQAEQFKAKSATEVQYAGSRYEIGYKEHGSNLIYRGDGSNVVWVAQFMRQYGVLLRGQYGAYDLRQYSPSLARSWGRTGVPDELEDQIKEHPVRTFALVRNYEEVRDAIANGYPVIVGSNIGFDRCRRHNVNGRDENGFLVPCGRWNHAMCFIAVDDSFGRPGCLCMNSWGPNWVQGGERHEQPKGSFWVDADVVSRMCAQNDAVAISNYIGYPAQPQIIDYNLFS